MIYAERNSLSAYLERYFPFKPTLLSVCWVRDGHQVSLFEPHRCSKAELCDLQPANGQTWQKAASECPQASVVFTLLKGCKMNQRRICDRNLKWPTELKMLTVWLFTDKVGWGHRTAKHWQQAEGIWSSHVNYESGFPFLATSLARWWEGLC